MRIGIKFQKFSKSQQMTDFHLEEICIEFFLIACYNAYTLGSKCLMRMEIGYLLSVTTE